ncbi:hypothetical protein FD06_GL001375 [Apilactobacillus ozensis DSM 23829 = JCM 17196]|uniref:WxL Interacting Protein peptidoglycan binding domain-containing protein n=1 Tax=Apilactobacillus ozensis DSM 23829 = JCM 17196 TaxID=1423781 RepID=A0A0R2ALV5_9LACO|nr:DUF916 domain-containing protein [Apilactobacillus ozensis]KRM68161.1 hypothetical protein FD06_GL001375 [Apilactobacillus ozensis DSM 23829 = JCM 17196]
MITKIILKYKLILLLSLIYFMFFGINIGADNIYQVNPILQSNNSKNNYFYYKYKSNQVLDVPFNAQNNTSKKIVVNTCLNDGYSDNNGYINYNLYNATSKLTRTVPKISDMVIGNRKITMTLNPYTSQKGNFKIKMPDTMKDFHGILLGGINSTSDYYIDSNKSNVRNTIQYSTSILINNHAPKTDVKHLSLKNFVSDGNLNVLTIFNNQSNIINGYKISISLYHFNRKVFNLNSENYSLAPNSFGKYNFNTDNLKTGQYRLVVKLVDWDGNYKVIKKNVKIKDDLYVQANINMFKINRIFLPLILVILIVFIFWILKKFNLNI